MKITNRMQNLKAQFTSQYHFLQWMVYVFLGGSIYATALYLYSSYFMYILNSFPVPPNVNQLDPAVMQLKEQVLINLAIPSILVFITPFILSLLLTKNMPEKQIVPPSFIHIIGLGGFIFYAIITPLGWIGLFFIGSYTYLCILFADDVIVWLVGRSVYKNMNKFSLSTNSQINILKNLFLDEMYRTGLGLSNKPDEIDGLLILKSPKGRKLNTGIEIRQDTKNQKCFINLIVYEKDKYSIQNNKNTEEFLNRQLDIIRGILKRNEIEFTDDNSQNASSLEKYISDNLKGSTRHLEKLSSLGWIKVVGFLAILITIGDLMYNKGSLEGVAGIVVMVLLYIVYETKEFTKRRDTNSNRD